MYRGLFLDRDGVVNQDLGYVHKKKDFRFNDGILELVAEAKNREFLVVIITNQSGIARRMYGSKEFEELSSWMSSKFSAAGGRIDRVYHCPHHPIYGWGTARILCTCRKPNPGMLLAAMKDLKIDPQQSILVGDKVTDVIAGSRAGIKTLVLYKDSDSKNYWAPTFPNILEIESLRDSHLYKVLQS